MPTLKLHYDGWLALPARLRQALGLNSGDRLEAELIDGTLVLRPAMKTGRDVPNDIAVNAPVADDPEVPVPEPTIMPMKRKPGRPRKSENGGGDAGGRAKPRGRGRPRASAHSPEIERAAPPLVSLGPPRLVKKADLELKAAAADPADPVAGQMPRVIRPDRAPQSVERRPFRNVEIRPLGPGRGHNRPSPRSLTHRSS